MDKKSIIGFVLIALVFTGWMIYQSVHYQDNAPPPPKKDSSSVEAKKNIVADTTNIIEKTANDTLKAQDDLKVLNDSLKKIQKYGNTFAGLTNGYEQFIRIETDLVKATLNSKGAVINHWTLKNYQSWRKQYPAQLINDEKGVLYITFNTTDNKRIDTRDFYFNLDSKNNNYKLSGNDSLTISAVLNVNSNGKIIKQFTFYGNKYIIKTDIKVIGLQEIIPTRGINYVWSNGIKYQEHNSVDESSDALSMLSLNGEIEEFDASDEPEEKSSEGIIDYAAVKTKYFGTAIIPQPYKSFDGVVDLAASKQHLADNGIVERYNMSFRLPYRSNEVTNSFQVYIGPLDYTILKDYGIQDMVNFGWRLLVRPIGEYFMLPIFNFIHSIIPNYGIAIIVFSLLMKILLYPLSISQLRSAQKMKLLGPVMEKMREKHKDDMQAQQKEQMKIYSEYGINPMGGCLPLVLQMPILYALWAVLRAAIDLRQADFFLWITDLSIPDSVLNLPFSFFGITHFSGLAILMGVTMFFQQKMTLTDPRQKSMLYMMPIMFTFMFSNFPSGLNLYYFMFNLMGIIQQVYINNFSRTKLTIEDLKKMPKKEGWLQKKMREAQEIAESQGRTLPGTVNKQNNRNPKQNNYRKKK